MRKAPFSLLVQGGVDISKEEESDTVAQAATGMNALVLSRLIGKGSKA